MPVPDFRRGKFGPPRGKKNSRPTGEPTRQQLFSSTGVGETGIVDERRRTSSSSRLRPPGVRPRMSISMPMRRGKSWRSVNFSAARLALRNSGTPAGFRGQKAR